MERLDQFDYQALDVKERWNVGETVDMLTSFEMEIKGYFTRDDSEFIFDKIHKKYWTYLTEAMWSGSLPYITPHDQVAENYFIEIGEDHTNVISSLTTDFDKNTFLECIKTDNKAKIDLDILKSYLSGEVTTNKQRPANSTQYVASTYIDVVNEDISDSKYPDFKGLKFDKLTNEQFTSLKQFYGIVKNEESKLRKAIPIAVKVGLLFYERSLGKPTTRSAFLDSYKEEFDAILKNDVLAKEIYRNLPEEYSGGRSSSQENKVDLLPTIKAAVYAGSIYDTDDAKDLVKLRKVLVGEEYAVPSDGILVKIIEATKGI